MPRAPCLRACSTWHSPIFALNRSFAQFILRQPKDSGYNFINRFTRSHKQGALTCGKTSDPSRCELVSRRTAGETALGRRFKRAISEGDLPAGTNAADLARYVVTVIHGMAVQAASGATRAELRRVIQTALRAWPK